MDGLILKTFVLGQLSNNCYLIFNAESKKGCIIDSPAPPNELDEFIRSNDLEIVFIALTHAHFDHIEGLDSNPAPFYIHKSDVPLLRNPQLNGSTFFSPAVIIEKEPRLYNDNVPLYFDKYLIEVLHTPGHTPGSVSLKLGNWLFSGDALFFNSIGRTDIPLASEDILIKSIKEKILTLSADTVVYPGHGPVTTVGGEKEDNPFL